MHKGFDSRLDQAWWVLRIGLGLGLSLQAWTNISTY